MLSHLSLLIKDPSSVLDEFVSELNLLMPTGVNGGML